MRHLPIFLEVGGKAAIVVGGGVVAARRAENLMKAGAVAAFAPRPATIFVNFSPRLTFAPPRAIPRVRIREFALCFVAVEDARRRRRPGRAERRPAHE